MKSQRMQRSVGRMFSLWRWWLSSCVARLDTMPGRFDRNTSRDRARKEMYDALNAIDAAEEELQAPDRQLLPGVWQVVSDGGCLLWEGPAPGPRSAQRAWLGDLNANGLADAARGDVERSGFKLEPGCTTEILRSMEFARAVLIALKMPTRIESERSGGANGAR